MVTSLRRKLILGSAFNVACLALILTGHFQPAIYLGIIAFAFRQFMPPPIPDLTGRVALANHAWIVLIFGVALLGVVPIPLVQRNIDQLFSIWCALIILGFGLIIYNDVHRWSLQNGEGETRTDSFHTANTMSSQTNRISLSSSASRDRLLQRIGDINNLDLPRPVVSLEEFFEGNDDWASIGYNLPDPPSPQEFFEFFKSIRDLDEVEDVLVEVQDLEDPAGWPATDTIWVVTYLSLDSLAKLLPEHFRPDEWINYPPGYSIEKIKIPAKMQAFAIWYD